ncbi:hypothetical protein [Streptomyces venezuelae]
MSQYLEAAARILERAEAHASAQLFNTDRNKAFRDIADSYTTLAAVDKGVLPPALARDIAVALGAIRPDSRKD